MQIAPAQLHDRLGIIATCASARDGKELMQWLESLRTHDHRQAFIEQQDKLLHEYLSNFPKASDAVRDAIEQEAPASLITVGARA